MRKSREEAAQTRKRIVEAASCEFREKGIVATGLADLMKAAGLTHGGFYKHFESKDQLVSEATAAALEEILGEMAAQPTTRDAVAACQQLINRRPSGVPRRPGDQDFALTHWNSPPMPLRLWLTSKW